MLLVITTLPTPKHKEAFAEASEKCPIKTSPDKDTEAKNAAAHKSMTTRKTSVLARNSLQKLQGTDYAPSLVWGGQLSPMRLPDIGLLIACVQA